MAIYMTNHTVIYLITYIETIWGLHGPCKYGACMKTIAQLMESHYIELVIEPYMKTVKVSLG